MVCSVVKKEMNRKGGLYLCVSLFFGNEVGSVFVVRACVCMCEDWRTHYLLFFDKLCFIFLFIKFK